MQTQIKIDQNQNGGRKIIILPEFKLARDVVPRYELYSRDGRRLISQEQLLAQPQEIKTKQHSIVFITPQQENTE